MKNYTVEVVYKVSFTEIAINESEAKLKAAHSFISCCCPDVKISDLEFNVEEKE